MADQLKAKRNLALSKLKDTLRKLQDGVAGSSKRLVEKYYADMHTLFTQFEDLHIKFVFALKADLETQEYRDVFFEAAGYVDTAEKDYSKFLDDMERLELTRSEQRSAQKEKEQLKKTLETLQLNYDGSWSVIESCIKKQVENINDGTVNVNIAALKDEIKHLEEKFKEMVLMCDELISESEAAEAQELAKEKANREAYFRQELFVMKNYVANNSTGSVGSRASSPDRGTTPQVFKTKKVDFPVFNGDIRAYKMFKRDFKDIVESQSGGDDVWMSHILRNQCLQGEPKTLVRKLKECAEIWKRLDNKYDDEGEVVAQINKQIQSLKPLDEGDYQGLVHLVDVVERANEDLSADGCEVAVKNNQTVRLIISKLPRELRENIAAELDGKKITEEFDVMLKFLVGRARNAQRLARWEIEKPKSSTSSKQKGAVHVAGAGQGDPGGGGKPWKCGTEGCTYKKRHFLAECRAFKKLPVDDRGKVVLKQNLCVLCFGAHKVDKCDKKASWKVCDVNSCGKWHSRLVHGAKTPGLVLHINYGVAANNKTMLFVQSIQTTAGKAATTLWDSGSTTSLITFSFADEADLVGVDCQFELIGVADKKESFKTKFYVVPLLTSDGEVIEINAFGIERITADVGEVDVAAIAEMFDVDVEKLDRPVGKVDLLIGLVEGDIMPGQVKTVNKLILQSSKFGTGFVFGGSMAGKRGNGGRDVFAEKVSHAASRMIKPLDFMSAEGFGVDVPRRCRNCRGCKECGAKAGQLTWTESMELAQIERGLTLDVEKKRWTAEYPYRVEPDVLKNNYNQAFACMCSLERRLNKTDNLQSFNKQFQDALDRNVFQAVGTEEMSSYTGPVNYITITEAFKDGAESTTPLRLCMNSSMKFHGTSLNDLMMKGPSALNNIFYVLLNFRSYRFAFVKDLSKFYNSVLASERDRHVRRVIWRFGNTTVDPTVYKTCTVNFGDKPAGCIALTAVRGTADLYKSVDEEAAEKLKDDNYVDDVASGAESKERAQEVSLNMEKIVEKGGFTFKETIMSGDDVEPRKILGTPWDVRQDELFLEVKVNVGAKHKGARTEANLDLDKVREFFPTVLTKRLVWRIVLGQFDLLGLASVFFVRLKLLMRDLSGEEGRKVEWDEPLDESVRSRFLNIIEMLKDVEKLRFPRCFKPANYDENYLPDLIVFGDGSKQAFCTLAYIRWRLMDGSFKCFLLTGKTRVSPLRKISVPRIELMGALAAVRIAENVERALKIKFGSRYFMTDSSAVFGMIAGECGSFQEFVGVRVGEIKSKSVPNKEWFWVGTKDNLADLGTRDDVTPDMMTSESAYQCGQPWMYLEKDKWPINQNPGKVPDEEFIPAARTVLLTNINTFEIDVSRFSTLDKCLRSVAIAFMWLVKKKLIKTPSKTGSKVEDFLKDAENFLLVQAQKKVLADFKTGKLSSLFPRVKQIEILGKPAELVVAAGRLGGALVIGYDKEELPIIPYDAPLAKLYMLWAHTMDHSGSDRTLMRSRNKVWTLKGRRLAEKIRKDCFKCKLRARNLEKQIMAPLPESRLPPAPVFHFTAVDLFGPIEIRDSVKKRTKAKCWGVMFCCTVTSAIHLEVSEDYSCDSFLLCVRRFLKTKGTPKQIQSDPGTQLIAAAKELGKWDFSKIQEWAAGQKTVWKFIPTNSQHYNGCAEALIKSTKNQLADSIKGKLFTKGELDTYLIDVAYIVNSRPLMKRPGQDILSGGPITPLHLMGGRSTIEVPEITVDCNPALTKRLRFLEETKNEFWKKWFAQVFHNLVPCYKWKTKYRDVMEGDVVLLRDSNVFKTEYKLAVVTKAVKGKDSRVRRVTLKYKNLQDTGPNINKATQSLKDAKFTETDSSVQNIAVIVPVDWTEKSIEQVVTQAVNISCAF